MSVPYSVSGPYQHNNCSVIAIDDGKTTWIQMEEMGRELVDIYNMEVRKDDVWLVGYPKSGNTWAAEMMYTIVHGGTKEALEISNFERICWPEARAYQTLGAKNMSEERRKEVQLKDSFKHTVECESPRVVRCHLSFSLLPPKLLDTCKVVYICRNMKDVITSFYKMVEGTGLKGGLSLDSFFEDFISEKSMDQPFSEHIKQAWGKRHHPNMYFLFYEEMKRDLPGVLRKVASFIGKSLTDEQVEELANYLSVESMRKNKNANMHEYNEFGLLGEKSIFIRKGISGDWKNHFTPAMNQKWEEWITEKFAGTGFKFLE